MRTRPHILSLIAVLFGLALLVAACEAELGDEDVDEDDVEDEPDEDEEDEEAEEADEPEDEEAEEDEEDEEDEEEPALDEGEGETDPDATEIEWATSDVGSSGHTALVNLSALLNREWEGFHTDVLPTGGALQSVIGYATGDFDAYYGADIGFAEAAEDRDRYEGFSDDAERDLVMSFWAYPMETGLAIHEDNADEFESWADLTGEPVFTSPAPWDVRANLEAAMEAAGAEHEYVEVDTGVAGSSLEEGDISAMPAYTTSETTPAPWVNEGLLQTDGQVLNPSDEEVAAIEDAGMEVVSIDPDHFDTDIGVDEALFVPFFYGFHVGPDVSAEDVYEKLDVIAEHADELADADGAFEVLANDPADLQRRGVESSVDDVLVHPGMADWMRDQGVWNDEWDDRIAE
ncbi:TRAP transporter substrate-binding protein [Egibacter rhizosphaerae]|uniref:TRAP transporter substrate-binding protein n=1 Tax=Egibacter rhizosphaerae TaxID=1670831 RepID=UPI0013F15027|nr:TRAP transporter substrate-binding protein [Egibacter rhizosphaerae]